MNSARNLAIAGLLLLAMAGCAEKKVKVVPAAQAQAPAKDAGEAGKAGAMYPPPLMTGQPPDDAANAPPPAVAKADPPPPAPPPQPNEKKPASTRKPKSSKPSTTASPNSSTTPATSTAATTADSAGDATQAPGSTAAPTPAQTHAANEMAAANGEPAASSPIGELSTGGAAGQSQTHKGTLDLINSTDNGVNAIKKTLTTQEQETVTQIKAFLSKARAAFENNDFDGATTLATKAKLLLDELNKD